MGASPSTGAVTFTEASAQSYSGTVCYSIIEVSGVDTSGTNGSGAVDTPGTNALGGMGASLGLTIPGTPDTGDVTFACFGTQDDAAALTSDALWDTLETVGPSSDVLLRNDYDDGQDQSPTWTWTGNKYASAIGFRINIAP